MDETLVDISNDVIYHIKKRTSQPLNEHIHIALTDHIAFAVKRLQQGLTLKPVSHGNRNALSGRIPNCP